MMAARRVTDRAERYRANKLLPVAGKSCLLCGSTRNLVPDHWDGHPDHTNPGNLEVLCKSCNTSKGAAFAKVGRGRLTNQYNPTKGGGAANVGEWVNAVGAITPHVDRGDRGLTTTMTTRDAVDMIRATPQSKRRDFAAKLRRKNPIFGAGRPRFFGTPYVPVDVGSSYAAPREKASRRAVPKPSKAVKAAIRAGEFEGSASGTWPSDAIFREGFRRGLTAREVLQENPSIGGGKPLPRGMVKISGQVVKAGSKRHQILVEQKRLYEQNDPRTNPGLIGSFGARLGASSPGLSARQLATYFRERFGSTVKMATQYRDFLREYRGASKRNPAAAAAEGFEEFHGYPPSEVVTVSKQVHHHKHLASAGDLVGLQVKPINGGARRTIEGLGECFLAFNEAKNQLFIEGGDQQMPPSELKKFGVTDEHELQTLGKLVGVGYFTNKKHLGKEGGEAVYSHTFRGINENGKHVIVTIARDPDLIYRVLDEQFEVSGGSYEILREGINR